MKAVLTIVTCFALSMLVFADEAVAGSGSWFLGVDAAYVEQTFRPYYTYASSDSSPDQFYNHSFGQSFGLHGGYRRHLFERMNLALQARMAFNNPEWELETDEPASLKYRIPYTHGLCLVPGFAVCSRVTIFAEAGVGQGCIQQTKESSSTTEYNNTKWAAAYVLGGGIRIAMGLNFELQLSYRQTVFEHYGFDSNLPDGTVAEHIVNDNYSAEWLMGLSRTF